MKTTDNHATEYSLLEDDELILAFCKGKDELALKCLINRHKQYFLGTCILYVKDTEIAKDILQESWIKVAIDVREGRYIYSGNFKGWMFKIVVNKCKDVLRKNTAKPVTVDYEEVLYLIPGNYKTPESIYMAKEFLAIVELLFERLENPKSQNASERFFFDGYKYREIAEELDVSINTVKTWIRKTRTLLKANTMVLKAVG